MVLFAKETSQHFKMPWNNVWGRSAEILYWWHITTQIWEVLLFVWGKFPTRHNQSETQPVDRSLVWNFYVCSANIISWVNQSWHQNNLFCHILQWESNNPKFKEGLGHIFKHRFLFFISLMIKSEWQLVWPLLKLLLSGCHGYLLVLSLIAKGS